MKKILSLVLAVAFILTTAAIPALAGNEVWNVDITSISEGDTFKVGSDILLAADATDYANVKNIDFYANGVKIPGTIVGNSGSITWYAPCEGSYDITTKINFIGGGDAVEGSEKVNVVVLPDPEKISLLWSGETNLRVGQKSSTTPSDDYAVFGTKSAKFEIIAAAVTLDCVDVDVNWTRGSVLLYSPENVPGLICDVEYHYLNEDGTKGTMRANAGGVKAINQGITYLSTGVPDATDKKLEKVTLTFDGAPDKTPVYILGIYGVKDSDSTPVATAEIGNNATDVCNEIGNYRINFSHPIFPDETKVPATVTLDGAAIDGVTYNYGFDYVDIKLPTLMQGKEYKVNIPANTIFGYYTFVPSVPTAGFSPKYVPATEFTFTTKNSECDSARPVVKMSYPKSGLTYPDNISFAAMVTAPSSAIKKAEFYSGEDKIGDGVLMTNGEWWCTPSSALASKEHIITAKFLNENNEVVAVTPAANYKVTKPAYFVKGIGNGDVIVADEESYRMVTVVDAENENIASDAATNVEKVEFYNEADILLTTDDSYPYEYKLVFDNYGTHTIKAKVYDVYSGINTYANSYTVVNGIKNAASYEQNFDNVDASYDIKNDFFGGKVSSVGTKYEIENNALKFTYDSDPNKTKMFAFKHAGLNVGAKVYYYEFDLTLHNAETDYMCGIGSSWTRNEEVIINTLKDGFKENTPYKIGIVLDFNTSTPDDKPTAIIRRNGVEMKRMKLDNYGVNNGTDVILHNCLYRVGDSITIDNFKFSVYDVDNTKAFGTGEYERTFNVADSSTNSISVTASATNTTDNAKQLVNIIAVYGENNVLLACPTIDKITYNVNDFKTQNYNVVLPNGAKTVRIFTWDGFATLTPVGVWKSSN